MRQHVSERNIETGKRRALETHEADKNAISASFKWTNEATKTFQVDGLVYSGYKLVHPTHLA